MRILAIAQQKGGTGKTTTAAAIGGALLRRGERVLFIDLDPQGNLSYLLGADQTQHTTQELLTGKASPRKAPQFLATEQAGQGAIIPASPFLSGADATITGTGREFRLLEALRQISGLYDFCIIDTPPALGILTVNALTAADSVIIPCLADVFSIQATGQIAATIAGIKASSNPNLKISGVLLTRYTPRQIITRETSAVLEEAARTIGTRIFNSRIRESVSIREAHALRQDIFTFNPKSTGAADYAALIDEITTTETKEI